MNTAAVKSTSDTHREPFTAAFHRAVEDVAGTSRFKEHVLPTPLTTSSSPSSSSPQLSSWLQYLVGFRDVYPDLHMHVTPLQQQSDHALPSFTLSSLAHTAEANPDTVFLHHVFDNAKEATLYVRVRQPWEFLRPETAPAHPSRHPGSTGDDSAAKEWSLMPFGGMLKRLEDVLQEMGRRELEKAKTAHVKEQLNASQREGFLLVFWRAILEQAFLDQYCEVAALVPSFPRGKHFEESQRLSVHDLYPYDYREQPAELRRRLDQGIRALLCASAFTLHAQWEQYMARHGPSNTAAHVLGLEFVLLWWYANPDQMPVELSSSVHRRPPCTQRQQRRLAAGAVSSSSSSSSNDGHSAGAPATHAAPRRVFTATATTGSGVTTVEQHLRGYILAHCTRQSRDGQANWRAGDGGFLCPTAMFPPSYQDALREHLRLVRHRKDHVTCPLFLRVLEVAVAAGSSGQQRWTRVSAAAANVPVKTEYATRVVKRGRQIAEQLVIGWLWPVVCSTVSAAPATAGDASLPPIRNLLHPAAAQAHPSAPPPCNTGAAGTAAAAHHHLDAEASLEKVEDWAVLVAVVTAVAQVRRHLLSLRRGNGGASGRVKAATATAPASAANAANDSSSREENRDGAASFAYIRDHFYGPAMCVLLCIAERTGEMPNEKGVREEASSFAVESHLPSWVFLVYAHVVACFQECGWLRRSVAHQPATPARLWHRLFHTLCAAFPNVFHAGNTVTVMWTLWAMEGAVGAPGMYYSPFQLLSKGRVEALQAWTGVLARDQVANAFRVEEVQRQREMWREAAVKECDDGNLAHSWFAVEDASTCPAAERREHSAYIAAAASSDESPPTQLEDVPFSHSSNPTSVTRPEKTVGHDEDSSGRWTARRVRRSNEALLLPTFASPCPSPPPPLHLCTEESRAQMAAYLAACQELREEVTSTAAQIFRHYATLPILRSSAALGAEEGEQSSVATTTLTSDAPTVDEVTRLRRMGQPSFFVLLKLLHSHAVLGDTFASEYGTNHMGSGDAPIPGLVPSVLRDALTVCHPVVASFLQRMLVYSATLSGRDGALALLFHDELQVLLNSLPQQLGRRRLVAALLWSGLPASTLTQADHDGTEAEKDAQPGGSSRAAAAAVAADAGVAFGSGSLAWRVLGGNQTHFFSTLPPLPATTEADPKCVQPEAASVGAAAEPPLTNTHAEVAGLVDEVVTHLWQLAIAVPEPARLLLNLEPHMRTCASLSGATAHDKAMLNAAATGEMCRDTEQKNLTGHSQTTSYSASSFVACRTLEGDNEFDGADAPLDTWADTAAAADADADDDDEGSDASSDWASETTNNVDDASLTAEMMASTDEDNAAPFARQWNSQAALRPSAVASAVTSSTMQSRAGAPSAAERTTQGQGESHNRGDDSDTRHEQSDVTEAGQANCRAVMAALRPALPSAQHLFYSLLEVLAWVANAQYSRSALATMTTTATTARQREESVPAFADQVGQPAWCAQLALHYRLCAAVWAARVGVRQVGEKDRLQSAMPAVFDRSAALCRPKLVEQLVLLLSQTCPDVYLLSLLLLNLVMRSTDGPLTSSTVQATLANRWERAEYPLPWPVECALAQLLFHAGETAATVRRWQASLGRYPDTNLDARKSDTFFYKVMRHHALLESFAASEASLVQRSASFAKEHIDEGNGATLADTTSSPCVSETAASEALNQQTTTPHDLTMSIGSLLLASLQLRFRSIAGQRPFYRRDYYVNEFLLNSFASSTDMPTPPLTTPLRAVLPSWQVKTLAPTVRPPSQVWPLRQLWRDEVPGVPREALRSAFRGKRRSERAVICADERQLYVQTMSGKAAAEGQAAVTEQAEDEYLAAFL